jgi:glycosyltransferase involved in cell wall biosynthesis
MTIDSFSQVIDDERIGEVVICDDASNNGSFQRLLHYFRGNAKVKLFQNKNNIDCYLNKRRAISLAKNEYCILLDSDNIINQGYIDIIYSFLPVWKPTVALLPSFAKPHFDFTKYAGRMIDKANVTSLIDESSFETCLNCANYFVNREEYLRVFDASVNPNTSDSIYQNYNWLKSGNSLHITKDLFYFHRVHNGSHYLTNNHKTGSFHKEVILKIKSINGNS